MEQLTAFDFVLAGVGLVGCLACLVHALAK